MFDSDALLEIWYSIKKNPLRSFMTGFGVLWGMFMLIIMLGSGNGLKNGVMGDMKNFATNSIHVWSMKTTKGFGGFKPGRKIKLTNEDTKSLAENIPDIEVLAPRNQLGGYGDNNNVIRGGKTGNFTVMGDIPDYFKVNPTKLTEGRLINQNDMVDLRKVCVIGNRVREVLYSPNEDPIGTTISIQGIHFTVVGCFISEKGRRARKEGETIYIPFSTFQKAFNYGNRVSWFSMLAKEGTNPEMVEKQVKEHLSTKHSVHPDDKMAFGSFTAGRFLKKMYSAFNIINIVVWTVGFFSLIAGIIGISNIMIVVVKERTKEIGVKRALGATPLIIIKQVVAEAFLLTAIAGYTGLISGVILLEKSSSIMKIFNVSDKYFKNPEIDFNIAIQALGLLIFAGMLAGLIPATRAAKIKPIEALREE